MNKQNKSQQHLAGSDCTNGISHKVNPIPNSQERIEPSLCLSSLQPLNYPSSKQFLNRDSLLLCHSVTVAREQKQLKI